MPKNVLKVDKFEGGQNDNADPRDIAQDEHTFLQDVHVNQTGKIKNMGASVWDTTKPEATGSPIPGYGLHSYNSGYGFVPSSGVQATNALTTYGTDGISASQLIQMPTISYSNAFQNLIAPTSQTVSDNQTTGFTINPATGWDVIVLGIFVQKWTTSDSGATYEKAGNPIALFGETGSGFKLASQSSATTGTLPNGGVLNGGKYRMPWNVTTFNASGSTGHGTDWVEKYNIQSNGVPGASGTTRDYGPSNFLVICDYDSSDNFTSSLMANTTFSFGAGFLSAGSGTNLVYDRADKVGTGATDDILVHINAAINAQKNYSGFESEINSNGAIRIFETTGGGAAYTFFSDFQRSDDSITQISNIEDGDDCWSGGTTGTDYYSGNFLYLDDAIDGDSPHTSGELLVPDLLMVAGFDGHDWAPSGYESWKGVFNWWCNELHDPSGSLYGESITTDLVEEMCGLNDYILTFWPMGISKSGVGRKQKNTITFSGSSAAGNAWTIDINGSPHTVTHGDTVDSTVIDNVNEWARALGYEIENAQTDGGAADVSGAVVCTPNDLSDGAGTTLVIEAPTAGTAYNFSCSLYPTGTVALTKVDDSRLAFLNNAGKLQIYSSNSNIWINDTALNNTGWSSASSATPTMYSDGGILRLSDGTHSSDNVPKVMAYYETGGTGGICGVGSGNVIVGHKLTSQDLSWKDEYTVDYDASGTSTTGLLRSANYDDADDHNGTGTDWYNATRLPANRWRFSFEGANTGNGDWSGKHKFHASAVYQDGSESLPSHHFTNTNVTPAASQVDATTASSTAWDFGYGDVTNKTCRIRMVCHPDTVSTWIFDERMIGIRLWHSKEEDNYSIYYHVGMVHFVDGFLDHNGVQLQAWRQDAGTTGLYTCTGHADSTDGSTDFEEIFTTDEDDTFENRVGYSSASKSITASYAHSTITGRRVWVGGIKYLDETGAERVHNDRMIASPVNMFDIFPTPYSIVDIDTSDGDSITALKSTHGKVLQFKSKFLYILNVADSDLETAFLESTHPFRGVTKPYHTIDVPDGVAWANKYGVFNYDGENIEDLMLVEEGDKQRKIKLSDWQSFFTDNSVIAYSPLDEILLIKRNIDASAETGENEADVYVYEFATKSWVTGKARLVRNKDCTNFVTLQDGTMITITFGTTGLDNNPGSPS